MRTFSSTQKNLVNKLGSYYDLVIEDTSYIVFLIHIIIMQNVLRRSKVRHKLEGRANVRNY